MSNDDVMNTDKYIILVCIYNSTYNSLYDSPYPCNFAGYSGYLYNRFELLRQFPFLCKAGLFIFNNEKSKLLSSTRRKVYNSGEKQIYKFSYYPNGYIFENDQQKNYDYNGCDITKLGSKGLFYIPDKVCKEKNKITYYSKKKYNNSKRELCSYIQCNIAFEVRLYGKNNYYYIYDDIDEIYMYEPVQHSLKIYTNKYLTSPKVKKEYSIKINNLNEFTKIISNYTKVWLI